MDEVAPPIPVTPKVAGPDEIKKLFKNARASGFVDRDELNRILPPEVTPPEKIEKVMAALASTDVEIIDGTLADSEQWRRISPRNAPARRVDIPDESTKSLARSKDPVQSYFHTPGTSAMLTREGEIAIAKRIEAGKN